MLPWLIVHCVIMEFGYPQQHCTSLQALSQSLKFANFLFLFSTTTHRPSQIFSPQFNLHQFITMNTYLCLRCHGHEEQNHVVGWPMIAERCLYHHTDTRLPALFQDYPRQLVSNQSGFYWSKRQWVAVASAGPYASLQLASDRKPCQHPTTHTYIKQTQHTCCRRRGIRRDSRSGLKACWTCSSSWQVPVPGHGEIAADRMTPSQHREELPCLQPPLHRETTSTTSTGRLICTFFFSGMHHNECVVPYVHTSLHRGRFWARSTASFSVRL